MAVVDSNSPPTVTISASPQVISAGTKSTITWSSTNSTSCTASDAWTGAKATSGSEATAALAVNSTYSLVCTGPGGTSAVTSVTVEVEALPFPTAITLTADPTTVTAGSATTLSWTTAQAESCTASDGWTGEKLATGGTEQVTPAATTTYTLRCVGTTEDTKSVTVTVQPAQTFSDVPPDYWAFSYIERLAASNITAGCGNGNYCPTNAVTRAQMAVFLERGMRGSAYIPPPATGLIFQDVGAGDLCRKLH